MTTHFQHLSLIEAVETLSSIAELNFEHAMGIIQKHEMVLSDEKIAYKSVHWLHEADTPSTLYLVRETFRMILHYLKHFYKKEYQQISDQKTSEEMKSVMVLVEEAAKKLDQYMHVFPHIQSVKNFEEFKQLQEFYQKKIAPQADEGLIGKWVLSLNIENSAKNIVFKAAPDQTDQVTDTKHVFVDLESVKKDLAYELFFIRKEDGSRFFSRRLLRNIKLVFDFGNYFGERKELNPLEHIKQSQDRVFHVYAKEILKVLHSRLEHFFKETQKVKNSQLVILLKKGLLALMLSAQSQNLLRHQPIKTCMEYFEDFQSFLREILQMPAYQKWVKNHSKDNDKFDIMHLVQALSKALYTNLRGLEEMKPFIQNLIQEALSTVSKDQLDQVQSIPLICNQLTVEYAALSKLLKPHPRGPLLKVLNALESTTFHVFDSLLQHNLPNILFDLYFQDKRISFLRLPAPIYQEFINKAIVNEEFKAFIQAYYQEGIARKHLLINLQDRTSWKEHARCLALENLQKVSDMKDSLRVVTLAIQTDFYHQLAPYHQGNHAHVFKEQFKELLLDESSGYFFPDLLSREELSQFIDQAFEVVHQIFFSSKNVLSRENRLDFIEIFYVLLYLKLIEWVQPDTVSLTCKDCIDSGEACSAEIFVFLKLIQQQEWTEKDRQHLNFMLYAPSLLLRERVMLPERFNRMLSVLKLVENTSREGKEKFTKLVKKLSGLYKTPILKATIRIDLLHKC